MPASLERVPAFVHRESREWLRRLQNAGARATFTGFRVQAVLIS